MFRTFEYRLYPTVEQQSKLNKWLSELRFLYNHALEERLAPVNPSGQEVTYYDQQKSLTKWRHYDCEGLGQVHRAVAEDLLRRLALGFRNHTARGSSSSKRGRPRFKRRLDSLSYPAGPARSPHVRPRLEEKKLRLAGIGDVRAVFHRDPPTGLVKKTTIRRSVRGWFADLRYKLADPHQSSKLDLSSAVGVDLGVNLLATLSNDERLVSPRFGPRAAAKLARLQRIVSRRWPSSRNRQRAQLRLSRLHAKIAAERRHFHHVVSQGWARRFHVVVFEELRLTALYRNRSLASVLSDAAWGQLVRFTRYKTEEMGHMCIFVPPKDTSQICSVCGRRSDPPIRKGRTFGCPEGHTLDRDLNAARNILAKGLAHLARNTREVTPGERKPDTSQPADWHGYSMNPEVADSVSNQDRHGSNPAFPSKTDSSTRHATAFCLTHSKPLPNYTCQTLGGAGPGDSSDGARESDSLRYPI